jgi:hypothetical protein
VTVLLVHQVSDWCINCLRMAALANARRSPAAFHLLSLGGFLSYLNSPESIHQEYRRSLTIASKLRYFYQIGIHMLIGTSGAIDDTGHDNVRSQLSYSPSLEAAVQLILAHPVFEDELETSSFKFIRAARFLKDNAPHVFQIREMRAGTKNSMDRWLWDLLDRESRSADHFKK